MKCTKCSLHKNSKKQYKPIRVIGVDYKIAFIFEYSSSDPSPRLIGKTATVFNYMLRKLKLERKQVVFIPNIWCPVVSPQGCARKPFFPEYITCIDNVYKYLEKINPNVIIYVGKDTKKYFDNFSRPTITMMTFDSIVNNGGVFSSKLEELLINLERYLS